MTCARSARPGRARLSTRACATPTAPTALFTLLISITATLLHSHAACAQPTQQQGTAGALPPAPKRLPLNEVVLPPGFSIELYVDATFPARFLALAKSDGNATVVFVSSTKAGRVSNREAGTADGQAAGGKSGGAGRWGEHTLAGCGSSLCADVCR